MIAAAGEENTVQIYNCKKEKTFKCYEHKGHTLNMAFQPENKYICTTGCDGYANIFNLSSIRNDEDPVKI